ncbi:hypothetical protein E4U32_004597 [Claviceps aff. humidiphila group G2b]|nr:hypothetical protein E4U32_004597 [Claviceps aff. humidiphila group G2b]
MPPLLRATGGFSSLIMSDSEPDFDDLVTLEPRPFKGNERKLPTSKRNNRRSSNCANRVTKSAPCLERSQNGARLVSHSVTSREILSEKNKSQSSTKIPRHQDSAEQLATQDKLSPVLHEGRSQHDCTHPERAIDRSECKADSARLINATTRDNSLQPINIQNPDAAVMAMSYSDLDRERDLKISNPTCSHNANDFILRKRSGDLTEQYHALEKRHVQLRDIGVKAAECNFERMKRQSMETAAASDNLIRELKAELAAKSDIVKQNEQIGRQLERSQANVGELEGVIADLTASLSKAKSEIQSLSLKLGTVRAVEAGTKVTASVMKTVSGGTKLTPSGAVLAAQAKEDLYGDLTGLIIRGTSQIDHEIVFDCIQTGRNGTLHFRLALEAGEDPEKYNEIQFTYRPQLDGERDRELMTILPDYLVEEITFTRTQASNFYGKLNKSLTERLG